MDAGQQDDPTDEAARATDGDRRRHPAAAVVVAAMVVLVVAGGYVGWWRNRPADVRGVVELDGRACFGWDGRIWTTTGTVAAAGRPPPFDLPATFVATGPHDGVLIASGTSVPASTSPTTVDPRLAVGCAIP